MTLSNELETNILGDYHAEKWRVDDLSRPLPIYHSIVGKMLSQAGVPKKNFIQRDSLITPFLSFVRDISEKYSRLAASRLYEMIHLALILNLSSHFFCNGWNHLTL